MPKRLPTAMFTAVTGTATISASMAAFLKSAMLRPLSRCQQATPKTTSDPVVRPTRIVCSKAWIAKLLVSSAPTSVSSACPPDTFEPTGCRIHEFATRMK